ncbi:MAG: class IV adenylate cyclase [Candidatus Aminicenantes bacterium]|nr:class IV adenylate cyclase [Candidatus Aminicenantes bacterium]
MTTEIKRIQVLEIEIKIKTPAGAAGVENMRGRILANDFQVLHERAFERNFVFDTPEGMLKTRKCLLRLRKKGNTNTVTFKRPLEKPFSRDDIAYKIKQETEVEVSDFEGMENIFSGLGYEVFFIYEKYREEFQKGDVKVMLDETPMGTFIEIEGPDEAINRTAHELGYNKNDYITDNYLSLFRKAGGAGHMRF